MGEPTLIELITTPGGLAGGGAIVALVYAVRWWLDYRRGSAQDGAALMSEVLAVQRERIADLEQRLEEATRGGTLGAVEVAALERERDTLRAALLLARDHPELVDTISRRLVESDWSGEHQIPTELLRELAEEVTDDT